MEKKDGKHENEKVKRKRKRRNILSYDRLQFSQDTSSFSRTVM